MGESFLDAIFPPLAAWDGVSYLSSLSGAGDAGNATNSVSSAANAVTNLSNSASNAINTLSSDIPSAGELLTTGVFIVICLLLVLLIMGKVDAL